VQWDEKAYLKVKPAFAAALNARAKAWAYLRNNRNNSNNPGD
jgi:hypothetical protein